MVKPPPLKPGDSVAITATARQISPSDVEAALGTLERWGLKVILSPYLFSRDHSYLAGTDEQRIAALQQFLDDPSIAAILCARGGYGTTRIIDQIDFTGFLNHPKWVVGFSDVTALHLKISTLGFESIHATMPILFGRPGAQSSTHSLADVLFDRPVELHSERSELNARGKGEGLLVGGNLSLLVDSLGTNYEPDTKGKILVLEEVDEYLYRIDRMIVQLKRAGKLAHLAGLVVGHFSDLKDTELQFGESFGQIIRFHTREYNYPVGFNFPIGHVNPNLAWIVGRKAFLEVSEATAVLKHER